MNFILKILQEKYLKNSEPTESSDIPIHFDDINMYNKVNLYGMYSIIYVCITPIYTSFISYLLCYTKYNIHNIYTIHQYIGMLAGPPPARGITCEVVETSAKLRILWEYPYCRPHYQPAATANNIGGGSGDGEIGADSSNNDIHTPSYIDPSKVLFIIECAIVRPRSNLRQGQGETGDPLAGVGGKSDPTTNNNNGSNSKTMTGSFLSPTPLMRGTSLTPGDTTNNLSLYNSGYRLLSPVNSPAGNLTTTGNDRERDPVLDKSRRMPAYNPDLATDLSQVLPSDLTYFEIGRVNASEAWASLQPTPGGPRSGSAADPLSPKHNSNKLSKNSAQARRRSFRVTSTSPAHPLHDPHDTLTSPLHPISSSSRKALNTLFLMGVDPTLPQTDEVVSKMAMDSLAKDDDTASHGASQWGDSNPSANNNHRNNATSNLTNANTTANEEKGHNYDDIMCYTFEVQEYIAASLSFRIKSIIITDRNDSDLHTIQPQHMPHLNTIHTHILHTQDPKSRCQHLDTEHIIATFPNSKWAVSPKIFRCV